MADEQPSGGTALVIIDMMNQMAFDGGGPLRAAAEGAADATVGLRDAAHAADMPVIFVNDNHGDWRADARALVAWAREGDSAGRAIAERLSPREDDLFVIKPHFSGFYATTLPAILPRLGVSRLVLTGIAADICVLFTAADAHTREYDLWVPADAVGSEEEQRTRWALDIMARSIKADVSPSTERGLAEWPIAA